MAGQKTILERNLRLSYQVRKKPFAKAREVYPVTRVYAPPCQEWNSCKELVQKSRLAQINIGRRRQWHPTPVLLPGKSHGRRSLVGCSPWVVRVGHDWVTSLSIFTFHFHALEKEMTTHSSVIAWRIPAMGKPGGLPSMGSHRVGHNWSNLVAAAAANIGNQKEEGKYSNKD